MSRRLRKDIEPEDSLEIIDGERIEVAKEIAQVIGEYFDKVIYKKFKKTLKNSKK